MSKTVRCIYSAAIDGNEIERTKLAEFWMSGENLECRWMNEMLKNEILEHGIITADGQLFPKDGKRFYDALYVTYAQSSFRYVTDENKGEHEN